MAKVEKRERKLITSLSNLEQVDKNFDNEISSSKEEKSYSIQIRMHQSLIDKFRHQHTYFLGNTGNYNSYKYIMEFFSMVLNEFIDELKKNNQYIVADKNFIEYVSRKGQRKKGERTLSEQDKNRSLVLGKYSSENPTRELWNNLIYSLAKKEEMKNMLEYSMGYFMFDIIDFIEKNKEYLIKKYQ